MNIKYLSLMQLIMRPRCFTNILFICFLTLSPVALGMEITPGRYKRIKPENMAIIQPVIDKLNIKRPIDCAHYPHIEYALAHRPLNPQSNNVLLINEAEVQKLTQEELEFIIAHEIGHLEKNHASIVPLSLKTVFLLATATGIISGSVIFKDKDFMKLGLFVESYLAIGTFYKVYRSHQQEFAADEYAALGLGTAQGGIRFFSRKDAYDSMYMPHWLETHPRNQQRIERLKKIQAYLENRSLNDLD